jgi:hypothetical protein
MQFWPGKLTSQSRQGDNFKLDFMYGKRMYQLDIAVTGRISHALAEFGIDSREAFMFFCRRICYLVSCGIETSG